MSSQPTPTVTDVDYLVGSHEIARMFGVSRQRVNQLVSRPDFPRPTVTLAMGKVWITKEVREWAEAKGREILDHD